jgi:hypothetical protein
MNATHDPVTAPAHYTVYPVQPIAITRHLSFCLGNAVKYVMRAPYKGGAEDLLKAQQYLAWERETPGPGLPHHVYLRVETAIDAVVNHLVRPRSEAADLLSFFLLKLDEYLATGNTRVVSSLSGAVDGMLKLSELRP